METFKPEATCSISKADPNILFTEEIEIQDPLLINILHTFQEFQNHQYILNQCPPTFLVDLQQKYEQFNTYLQAQKTNPTFLSLIVESFLHISIETNQEELNEIHNAILFNILSSMNFFIINLPQSLQIFYSNPFLNKLIEIFYLRDLSILSEAEIKVVEAAQFLFTKLLEDPFFIHEKYMNFWYDIGKSISNRHFRSSVFLQISKEKSQITFLKDFIYDLLVIFPSSVEEIRENVSTMISNTQSILNSLQTETNPEYFNQAKHDVDLFLPKFIALIMFDKSEDGLTQDAIQFYNLSIDSNKSEVQGKSIELFDIECKQIICFCDLVSLFIEKGILDESFIENQAFFVIHELMSHLEICTQFSQMGIDPICIFNSVEKVLILFSDIVVYLKIPINEFISVQACLDTSFNTSFSARKAATLLICNLIENTMIDFDVENEVNSFILENSMFFELLLEMIISTQFDFILPFMECMLTLLYQCPEFVRFIISEFETAQVIQALETIIEQAKYMKKSKKDAKVKRMKELAIDLLDEIDKNMPKSENERINHSYFENNDVY